MPWHVIQTKPAREIAVEEALKEASKLLPLRLYLPSGKEMRFRGSGRKRVREEVRVPVFPRYLFVAPETDEAEDKIKHTEGVVDFLRCPERRPWVLLDKDLQRIRIAEAAGDFDRLPKRVTYAKDQELVIRRGPFTGFKAKFLSRDADERVRVLMRSLVRGGGDYPATLHLEDIEAVA